MQRNQRPPNTQTNPEQSTSTTQPIENPTTTTTTTTNTNTNANTNTNENQMQIEIADSDSSSDWDQDSQEFQQDEGEEEEMAAGNGVGVRMVNQQGNNTQIILDIRYNKSSPNPIKHNLPPQPLQNLPPAQSQPLQPIIASLRKAILLSALIKLPPTVEIRKQVCAKVLKKADTVVQCFDCRMDPSCIICEECFKNGNHEGHRFVIRKNAGGCCDCGDPEAWSVEGFCKYHSGEFREFEVRKEVVEEVKGKIDGLMYLYFYYILTQNPLSQTYTNKLLNFLQTLNNHNTYYNKITALCLTTPLSASYPLPPPLNTNTILQSLLNTKLSQNYFHKFFQLFITMFSYYPFKMSILKHYIQNYGYIVDGSKRGQNYALSVSCQLMTSYKVVRQYAVEYGVGLGQGSPVPKKIAELERYYTMLMHDIGCLGELAEDTPYVYWKMHINSSGSIKNLFKYYKILMKTVKGYQADNSKSQTQIIAKFINFSTIQFTLLQNFVKIIRIILNPPPQPQTEMKQQQQPDPYKKYHLLQTLIHLLWTQSQKLQKQQEYNPESLPILRPYERCLVMCLFAYFDYSLQNVANDGRKRERLIGHVLGIDEGRFLGAAGLVMGKLEKTVFFYGKTQAKPGLGQTSYVYLYFYKIHSKLMAMTDILGIKMFILLRNSSFYLTFKSAIQFNPSKIHIPQTPTQSQSQQQKDQIKTSTEYLKQKTTYFTNILKLLKLYFTTPCPEIHVAYAIHPSCGLYTSQIKELIVNYFKEYNEYHYRNQEGAETLGRGFMVGQSDLKSQLLEGIFSAECRIVDAWVKENCVLNKGRKCFVLDGKVVDQYRQQTGKKLTGLNFDDFWLNIASKDSIGDFQKSLPFINGYNQKIFNFIWNSVSLDSLNLMIRSLFFLDFGQSQNKNQGQINQKLQVYSRNTEKVVDILPFLLTLYFVINRNKKGEKGQKNTQQEGQLMQNKIIQQKIEQNQNKNQKKLNQFNSLLEKIILKYKNKIPKEVFNSIDLKSIIAQNQGIKNQQKGQQLNKKQKMNQIKNKKLQKFKKKQQTFFQQNNIQIQQKRQHKQTITQIQQPITQKQQIAQQLPQQKHCCICRTPPNETSIYILNLSIRDHEKLLKLGTGMQCLALSSCRHMFDYKCIYKSYTVKNMVDSVKCPLCKFKGNLLFPASKKYATGISELAAERVMQILRMVKEKMDLYEEVVKAFYHYVLLCSVDFKKTISKKHQLYSILLTILKSQIPPQSLKQLSQKLTSHKISTTFDKTLKSINTPSNALEQNQRRLQMLLNLINRQNFEEAISISIHQEQKLDVICQPGEESCRVGKGGKEGKEGMEEKEGIEGKVDCSELFMETVRAVLGYLQGKEVGNMEEEMSDTRKFVHKCLSTLINPQKDIKPEMTQPLTRPILKKLPQSYISLLSQKKCSQCSQMSPYLIICLICDWIGCQSCQKGYAKFHLNQVHGQVGAFMILQRGKAYYITNQRNVYAGELYQDQWGNNIMKNQDWEKFVLNQRLYAEMERNILLDEIPTRDAAKQ